MVNIITTGAEPPAYISAVSEFLEACEKHQVRAVALVALCDDEDTADLVAAQGCGPHELSQASGILAMHAAFKYMEVNREEEEYDE